MATSRRLLKWSIAGVLIPLSLSSGCSGTKTYPNNYAQNLRIQTATDSTFFSTVRAAVNIYGVDHDCRLEYQGTVQLDKPTVSVGIPPERPSYLVFDFDSSSFLGGSRSTISYETLLKPSAGRIYEIEVSYADDIYNVEMRETDPHKHATRDVDPKDLRACPSV